MTQNKIQKIIEIDASSKIVFDALTKPENLTQWFPDQAIFEPKVGGKMHFSFLKDHNMKDTEHYLDGEILEFIPNKKLVYTFIPDPTYKPDGASPTVTTVTWSIEEISKNKTRVTLTHVGFTQDMVNQFKETTDGWNFFTARLVEYCKKKFYQL
ncbi:MAG: SRPBCC domain-containing protein [Thaumarchaeota archaeon]|nr:SRPBCC domain-containing protein [Nitrososphaerota archaeon]